MPVPVVPMRVRIGAHNQIEYRLCQFANPETGRWSYFIQSRVKGHPWGEAVEMELSCDR